jgi:transposase
VDANRESRSRSGRGNQPLRRRRFTLEQKRGIVEASMQPGASVSRVARDHDVNTNQVFKWRRLHEQGLLGAGRKAVPMLPVRIEDPAALAERVVVQGSEVETEAAREVKPGSMEIELRGGRVTVRGAVDRAVLRVVITMLQR